MGRLLTAGVAAVAALAPTVGYAHPGHGDPVGFAYGFMHPIGGLDHVLAMVTVGILAYQIGGRALWLVPTSFVLVMACAGVLGAAGIAASDVEVGIAASVVVLGAAVTLGARTPVGIAMALAGLFAAFHGYAHGAEVPATASVVAYGVGFLVATALLHAAGIAFGVLLGRISHQSQLGYRLAGSMVTVAGLVILTRTLV